MGNSMEEYFLFVSLLWQILSIFEGPFLVSLPSLPPSFFPISVTFQSPSLIPSQTCKVYSSQFRGCLLKWHNLTCVLAIIEASLSGNSTKAGSWRPAVEFQILLRTKLIPRLPLSKLSKMFKLNFVFPSN